MSVRTFFQKLKATVGGESLGLELKPGAKHYRAYIGPPEDYDLVAAMSFNLLTTLGLRQHHTLLDVGCGSLRLGRLFIPYLNAGNYTGIEPNRWLVDEGIQRETGREQIRIKQPRFYFGASADSLPADEFYDFAVAQSIFSHCGPDLLDRWLQGIAAHLESSGVLAATFLIGEQDCQDNGWLYPKSIRYRVETMAARAEKAGLKFHLLDWRHPRQQWALYSKPGFNAAWFENEPLTWNTWLEHAAKGGTETER
jgi:cyclopropane fatty-acyl-phospholipid synthase-like methyltransferase